MPDQSLSYHRDILLEILTKCEPHVILKCAQVCKLWNRLIQLHDSAIWKHHSCYSLNKNYLWKSLVQEHYFWRQNLSKTLDIQNYELKMIDTLQKDIQYTVGLPKPTGVYESSTMTCKVFKDALWYISNDYLNVITCKSNYHSIQQHCKWIEPGIESDYLVLSNYSNAFEGGYVSVYSCNQSDPRRLYTVQVLDTHHIGYVYHDLYVCCRGWWMEGPLNTVICLYKLHSDRMELLWTSESLYRPMEITCSQNNVAIVSQRDSKTQSIELFDISNGHRSIMIQDEFLNSGNQIQKLLLLPPNPMGMFVIQSFGILVFYNMEGKLLYKVDLSHYHLNVSPFHLGNDVLLVTSFLDINQFTIIDLKRQIAKRYSVPQEGLWKTGIYLTHKDEHDEFNVELFQVNQDYEAVEFREMHLEP